MEENQNQTIQEEVQSQQPQFKSPFPKFILILIAVLVLGIVIGGAYYLGVNKNQPIACTQELKQCPDGAYVPRSGPNCEFTPCPPVQPKPTIDLTEDWTTYTNTFYSYSFRYPKSWFLKPMSEKSIATRDNVNSFDMADLEGKVLSFSGENVGIEFGLVDTKKDTETLEDWHARYESKLGFKDIAATKKKINNIDAIERIAIPPEKAIIYYIANKESIFIIRINGEKESNSFKIVNQILSTFKFTQ